MSAESARLKIMGIGLDSFEDQSPVPPILPSEDDIKQYLLENIPEEKFKELKEEEETTE